jgi:Ca2+ transporting ATPase
MGSANFVCTDKTGTLTKNEMKIEMFYNLDENVQVSSNAGKSDDFNYNNDYRSDRPFASGENCSFAGEKLSLTSKKHKIDCEYQKLVEQGMAININISSEVKDGKKQLTKDCNATDKSFYYFIQESLKIDYFKSCEKYFADVSSFKIIPFTSETKTMTTLIKNNEFGIDGYRMFIKGGPDVILPKAKFFFNKETNKAELLTESKITKINKKINDYASDSLRTIGFAYKDIDTMQFKEFESQEGRMKLIIDDFILLGIVGIKDPLKEGVLEAVSNCKKSGISVIMVTGDNIVTARAIAKECGIVNETQNIILKKEMEKEEQKRKQKSTEIIQKSNIAILGPEFSSLVGIICDNEGCKKPSVNVGYGSSSSGTAASRDSEVDLCKCYISEFERNKTIEKFPNDQALKSKQIRKEVIANPQMFEKIVENLRIIARAQPIDKYILVLGLKALGHVVAVTGDGTNDAQALAKADVGFAMGKAGTDIAKDASDIILLDDNFASIITAVKYGRNIFDCIQKFIQFQLTVNMCSCLVVFITACIGNETPLTAIQMMWVNLIMDSMGSLALATEPPNESKLLRRKPYGRDEYIVNKTMWKHVIVQSVFQIGLNLFLYLYGANFIREDNLKRIVEADLIYLCYGKYPGLAPDSQGHFIIDGSVIGWPSSQMIRSGFGIEECGNYGSKTTMSAALSTYKMNNGNSSHMTIIFNTFVIYTLFNQFNARIIDDDFNIFVDIHKSPSFILIEFIEAGLHVILIQFSGALFKVNMDGLTVYQWGICVGFSLITFLASFVGKLFMRHNNVFVYNETVVNYEEEMRLIVNVQEKNSINNKYADGNEIVVNSKSIFNPSNIRNSSKKQQSLRNHFPKQ